MLNKLKFIVAFFTILGYNAGLIIVIAAGFIDSSQLYSIPLRIAIAIIMIFLIFSSHLKITHGNKLNLISFWAFWILYFGAILKASIFSADLMRNSALTVSGYSIIYAILPFIFFSSKQNERTIIIFKNAIIVSGVLLSILTFYLYKDLLFQGIGRISMAKYQLGYDFVSISPLALSYASSLIIAICIYYISFLKLEKVTKLYYWFAVFASLAPFFLGASRGGVVALVFTFGFIVFYRQGFKSKIFSLFLIAFLSIIIFYLSVYFESSVITRVLNISDDIQQGSSSTSRLELWQSTWVQFISSPIWGDSIQSILPPHPHNILLESLMAVGILGTIPLMLLIFAAFRKSIKIVKYRPEHGWTLILFLQGFIQHMFSGTIYTAIFFWAGMGLVFSIEITNIRNRKTYTPTLKANEN